MTVLAVHSKSLEDTLRIAGVVGHRLSGGEVIELVGDLGSGKTAFVRGLAKGIGSRDVVQSPTFTISRVYKGNKVQIHHFDFHRLDKAGIVAEELSEVLNDPKAVVVIEWSSIIKKSLPQGRLQAKITLGKNIEARKIELNATDDKHQILIKQLQ